MLCLTLSFGGWSSKCRRHGKSTTWPVRAESGAESRDSSATLFPTYFVPSSTRAATMTGKFEPKVPVNLDPPRDDPISPAELAKATGISSPLRAQTASDLSWHRREGASMDSSMFSLIFGARWLTWATGVEGGKCYVAIKA